MGQLAPVACWDAAQKKIHGGDSCLDLVTPGTGVRFDDGSTALVTGQAASNAATCGVSRVATVNAGDAAAFAVWPDSATLGLRRLGDAGHTPDAAEKQALEALARAAVPDGKQPLVILQALSLDLAGDGKLERLYSVAEDSGDPAGARFAWSALVYGDTGGLHVLESSTSKTWRVDASLDLDHDGQHELWLTTELYDQDKQSGTGNLIGRIAAGPKLDAIGEISCFAQ